MNENLWWVVVMIITGSLQLIQYVIEERKQNERIRTNDLYESRRK